MEIGTYDGVHGCHMIRTASAHYKLSEIEYFGFDLFEDLSEELLASELSKKPPSRAVVESRLMSTGARVRLYAGDTKITLPGALDEIGEGDFVFIDGGHSIASIASDWYSAQRMMGKNTTVVLDDYYLNQEEAVEGMGCQTIVDALDRDRFNVEVLPIENAFEKEWGVLRIKMARVTLR